MYVKFLITLSTSLALVGLSNAEEKDIDPVPLREVLAKVADDVKRLVKSRPIAIGKFEGPRLSTGGPSIQQTLIEELKKKGVAHDQTGADIELSGKYTTVDVPPLEAELRRVNKFRPEPKMALAIELVVVLTDTLGKPLGGDLYYEEYFEITDERSIIEVFGPTGPLQTKKETNSTDRAADMKRNITAPQADVQGSVIRSKKGQPFAMELLVDDAPLAVEVKGGRPFATVPRGKAYAVRLINEAPFEAAVQLRIDGLSMFTFSELRQPNGEPKYTAVILPPHKDGKPGEAIIRGWHVNNEVSDKFVVTEYAKSAAASLKHTADIGTITATFQATWTKGKLPDEPEKGRGGMGDATGRGDRIGQEYQEVVRNLGAIRDCISVRYTK